MTLLWSSTHFFPVFRISSEFPFQPRWILTTSVHFPSFLLFFIFFLFCFKENILNSSLESICHSTSHEIFPANSLNKPRSPGLLDLYSLSLILSESFYHNCTQGYYQLSHSVTVIAYWEGQVSGAAHLVSLSRTWSTNLSSVYSSNVIICLLPAVISIQQMSEGFKLPTPMRIRAYIQGTYSIFFEEGFVHLLV